MLSAALCWLLLWCGAVAADGYDRYVSEEALKEACDRARDALELHHNVGVGLPYFCNEASGVRRYASQEDLLAAATREDVCTFVAVGALWDAHYKAWASRGVWEMLREEAEKLTNRKELPFGIEFGYYHYSGGMGTGSVPEELGMGESPGGYHLSVFRGGKNFGLYWIGYRGPPERLLERYGQFGEDWTREVLLSMACFVTEDFDEEEALERECIRTRKRVDEDTASALPYYCDGGSRIRHYASLDDLRVATYREDVCTFVVFGALWDIDYKIWASGGLWEMLQREAEGLANATALPFGVELGYYHYRVSIPLDWISAPGGFEIYGFRGRTLFPSPQWRRYMGAHLFGDSGDLDHLLKQYGENWARELLLSSRCFDVDDIKEDL